MNGPRTASRRRLAIHVVAVLVSSLLALLALEVTARVYLVHFAPESRFLAYASYAQLEKRYSATLETGASLQPLYTPHRYLGYFPTPGYQRGLNRHNELGYRGDEIVIPKPSDEFRVVCMGGSTTYTSDVEDYRLSYPSQLERELRERGFDRVRVINAGAAGWTTWESLINFELRILDLEPDLLVIYQAINDVHARLVWPPEAYRGDASGYRAPNGSGLFMPGLLEYSTLARVFLIRMGLARSHADLARTIDRLAPTYYGDLFREQVRNGVYPEGPFVEVSAARMLETNRPIYYERNLDTLIGMAQRNGIAVLLASFAYSPYFPEEPRVTTPEYQGAIAEHNQVMQRLGQHRDVAYFDFAALFPQDRQYWTDGRHVNERGAALKASLFADFLIDAKMVPGGTAQTPRKAEPDSPH